jgi:hypothetical protein
VASRTLRTSYDLNARGYHSYRQEKPAMQPARNVMRVSTRHAVYSCQNAYIRRSMPGFMDPMSQIGTYCELEARNIVSERGIWRAKELWFAFLEMKASGVLL